MDEHNIIFRTKRSPKHIFCRPLSCDDSLSSTENLTQSLPDCSTIYTEEVLDLKNMVQNLQQQLQSAHNEIDNLSIEKSELQRKIHNLELKVKELTIICREESQHHIVQERNQP